MPTTVKYYNPHLPDGYEVTITSLPVLLLNNTDVEVSDEAIAQYNATGKNFSDLLKSKVFGGAGNPAPKPETENKVEEKANESTPNDKVKDVVE